MQILCIPFSRIYQAHNIECTHKINDIFNIFYWEIFSEYYVHD